MNILKFAVIHSLDKELGNNSAQIRFAASVLDAAGANVIKLSDRLTRLIADGSGSLLWGQFGDNNRQGKFPAAAQKFQGKMQEDVFYAMSKTAMEELKQTINGLNFATGGYVCFLAYESGGNAFLLIAMIKERDALTLSKNFELREINEIDLTKLHQAARINLTRFGEVLALTEKGSAPRNEEDEGAERTYLCFAKAKDGRDVSDYFVKALGCVEGISSSRATKGIVRGIAKFVRGKPEIKQFADKARELTLEFLRNTRDGQTISLDHVISAARRCVGPDLEEHFGGLKGFLSGEQHKIPYQFSVNHAALTQWTRIKGSGSGWKISFENHLLGYKDSQIIYNKVAKSLTFTGLPDSTIEEVESALNSRDGSSSSSTKKP